MPSACVHSKSVSFWLGDGFEASCPHRPIVDPDAQHSSPAELPSVPNICNDSGLPVGRFTKKQVGRPCSSHPWESISCGRLLQRARLPRTSKLHSGGSSESDSYRAFADEQEEESQSALDSLTGLTKLKAALEPLGGLPAAYLLRKVFVNHPPKRRALCVAACLLLLQGETACLQRSPFPLEWMSLLLPVIAEDGARQGMAALLRLVQISGCASLVFACLAPSHPAVTVLALACLNASRCLEQRALGELLRSDVSSGAAGVHWPFLGACVGGGLLHLGAAQELLMPFTAVPGVLVVLWTRALEREVRSVDEGSSRTVLESSSLPCLPALQKPLGIAQAIPTLWEVLLPFGVWGPWLSNADFQISMVAFAAPLLPFEAAVTLRSGSCIEETKALGPNQSGKSFVSLQLLRIIGVAHVVWFHQLHEGSMIERLSCSVDSGSFLCHVGMAGMYWVGFFFMLSGFANAYQHFGRKKESTDIQDDRLSFAWKRISNIYPQYFCAVVVGAIGTMLAAQGVQAFALQPGNLLGVLKALTFSNVLVYPYSYGNLYGLSHLWYMCSLVVFWFRFEDWAEFLQKLPRKSAWMVLLYCWIATLGMSAVDHFGMLVPGSIVQQVFTTPRYFAFYHPVNNWMFFAGGVAIARLLQPLPGSESKSIGDAPARVWRAADWAMSRFGASTALAAVFLVIPLVDWASPSNILFRSVHGYLAFPGFATVIFAATREKDLLLSLPSKLHMDKWLQMLGEMSGPCFLMHKPLHEVQWMSLPLIHVKLTSLAMQDSILVRYVLAAVEWTYANGMFVHWGLVLGGGAAVYSLLPARKNQPKALPSTKEDPEQLLTSPERWTAMIQDTVSSGLKPLQS